MPITFYEILNFGNHVIGNLFVVEMVLKIFGLGFKNYVKDKLNIFDAIIVITSFLEYAGISTTAIMVFRLLRIIRIFKIVRTWTTLKRLL